MDLWSSEPKKIGFQLEMFQRGSHKLLLRPWCRHGSRYYIGFTRPCPRLYTENPKKNGTTQKKKFLQKKFATANLMHDVHKVVHLNR
jgi:hypothetical protein